MRSLSPLVASFSFLLINLLLLPPFTQPLPLSSWCSLRYSSPSPPTPTVPVPSLSSSSPPIRLLFQSQNQNQTTLSKTGRTSPQKLSNALGLHPGKPFPVNSPQKLVDAMLRSNIFSVIHCAKTTMNDDHTVTLDLVVTEPKANSLEYGMSVSTPSSSSSSSSSSTSSYSASSALEGSLVFSNRNLFGLGEKASLSYLQGGKGGRKGSLKVKYEDDVFDRPGGFEVESYVEGEFNPLNLKSKQASPSSPPSASTSISASPSPPPSIFGMILRINKPLPSLFLRSSLQLKHEASPSTTSTSQQVTLGPVIRPLPFDIPGFSSRTSTLIYGSASNTTVFTPPTPFVSFSFIRKSFTPVFRSSTLATLLTFQTSIPSLPTSLQIQNLLPRGYSSLSNQTLPRECAKGTVELRVPLNLGEANDSTWYLPRTPSLVFFTDYLLPSTQTNRNSKASQGFGVRGNIAGLPVKVDVCVNKDGNTVTSFGVGGDFELL